MTRNELDEILHQCYSVEIFPEEAAELIWGRPFDGVTEKTTQKDEAEKHETAEEKVAWLTEILVTKANDPVFTGYWLRLARRNLQLGLPLKTEEPELNPTQPQ
jgi:hypothetical protein